VLTFINKFDRVKLKVIPTVGWEHKKGGDKWQLRKRKKQKRHQRKRQQRKRKNKKVTEVN